MGTRIMNGGVEGAILNILDDLELSEEQLSRKKYLNSLPKNQWINLDENGLMISTEEAELHEKEYLKKIKPINKTSHL